MTGRNDRFDDFLGLDGRDLSRFRVIAFHGRSGSGKSTSIRHLLERFPDAHMIDEITTYRDLIARRAGLRVDALLLVATHVHPAWLRIFTRGPMAVFHTDRDASKIARYLDRLGIATSRAAVDLYVRKFGATYTDIDLILERCPSSRFDESLARFTKFHRIELASARASTTADAYASAS